MSLIDSNTVRVKRGGSFLTIPKLALDRYIAKGYDLVDAAGNVVQADVPNDLTTLKRAYEQRGVEIKALKERIKVLEDSANDTESAPTTRRAKKSK